MKFTHQVVITILFALPAVLFMSCSGKGPTAPAATPTPAPPTATFTACGYPGNTCTFTSTPTPTDTVTITYTPTNTNTFTNTFSPTITNTPTNTSTGTLSPVYTATFTRTSTKTAVPTATATMIPTQKWVYDSGITVIGAGTPGGVVEGAPVSLLLAMAAGGTAPYSYQLGSMADGAPPLGTVVNTLFQSGLQEGQLVGTPSTGSSGVNGGEYVFNVCAVDLVGKYNCAAVTVDVGAMTITSVTQTLTGTTPGCSTNGTIDIYNITFNGMVSGPVGTLTGFGTGGASVPAWTSNGYGDFYRATGQPQSTAFTIQWTDIGLCSSEPETIQNSLTVDNLIYSTPNFVCTLNY
jgi:hypothetical protein